MKMIDKQTVQAFLNDTRKKLQDNPRLYVNSENDTVTIGLPTELLEYANRAAGHSGLNNGARPTGIRIKTHDAISLRDDVLSSDDAYIDFITKNADNGYYDEVIREHKEYIKNGGYATDNRPIEGNVSVIVSLYGKKVFIECSKRNNKEEVLHDRKTLTIAEFESKYNLVRGSDWFE